MKKKNLLNAFIITFIIFGLCSAFYVNLNLSNEKTVKFLKKYGWEVNPEPIEKSEFIIPLVFDDVYINYNELQKEAGLDLIPYAGCEAVRYTYEVLNFPEPTKSTVRANVILVDSEPVGGDISTVNIDGFMYSLNFNTKTCFKTETMPW